MLILNNQYLLKMCDKLLQIFSSYRHLQEHIVEKKNKYQTIAKHTGDTYAIIDLEVCTYRN